MSLKNTQRCNRCGGTGRLYRSNILTRSGRPFQIDASDFPVHELNYGEDCPGCHGTGRVETEVF